VLLLNRRSLAACAAILRPAAAGLAGCRIRVACVATVQDGLGTVFGKALRKRDPDSL